MIGLKSVTRGIDPNQVLNNVPLLANLNKSQRKMLADNLVKQQFKTGQTIMKEGEPGDFFVIIVQGKVEVKSKQAGHLAFLSGGDYAGEQALLKAAPRNATLKAVEPTTCLVCNKKTFDKALVSVTFAKREGKRKAFYTPISEEKTNFEGVQKDKKMVNWILECVNDNLLFLKLDRQQRERVVQRMHLVKVPKGSSIIKQGDVNATTFYVCESGTFDIIVDKVKVGQYKRGGCFGELALLYDSPRAATILATSNAEVWEVSRNAFRYEVAETYKQKNVDIVHFLKKVELFKPLLNNELALIADALQEILVNSGDVVIKEGDKGDKFYVIRKGTCQWSKSNGEHGELTEGMFFGERALRTKERRAATITSTSKLLLLAMTARDFEALLGPVIEVIDGRIKQYKRMTEAFEKEQKECQLPKVTKSRLTSANEKTNGTDKNDDIETVNAPQEQEIDVALRRDKVCGLHELVIIGVLGKGAFGLVSLVEDPTKKKTYALKAIKKSQIVELKQQAHIISEKRVMEKMFNKFLVNLHCTYKNKLRVYFLLDACLGGELFTILRRKRYFDETTAKFYTACVVEAFAYMHSKDIVYRDLKPENLVLDSHGYLKVTDFGFAKIVTDKTFTLCGTPDYLAPEIVIGQGHGRAVDWWTLGVLIYEMLASFPPFFDEDPMLTYRKIIRGLVKFPRYFTQEARELIRQLLRSRPVKRLGILKGGADNIRTHPWFQNFPWKDFVEGTIQAPIVNPVKDHKDLSNFVNSEEDLIDDEPKPLGPGEDFSEEF